MSTNTINATITTIDAVDDSTPCVCAVAQYRKYLDNPLTNERWQPFADNIRTTFIPEKVKKMSLPALKDAAQLSYCPMLYACEDINATGQLVNPQHLCLDINDSLPCRVRVIRAYPIIDLRAPTSAYLLIAQNLQAKYKFNGIKIPSPSGYHSPFYYDGEWWGVAYMGWISEVVDNRDVWYFHVVLHNFLIKEWEPPQGVEELLPDLMRIQLDVLRRGEE